MVEKIRLGSGEWNFKKWFITILFGAMCFVFALQMYGVGPGSFGESGSGVAAVVNNRAISLTEFRQKVEPIEANARQRFDALPEQERRARMSRIKMDVLNQMVIEEAMYQAAVSRGIIASDAEVKAEILQLPYFLKDGHFSPDLYRSLLSQNGLNTEDFENRIRKQIVTQKLQELFVGSSHPSREELKHNRMLADQKLALRFAEVSRDDMGKFGSMSEADVKDFEAKHKSEIEAYYRDNKIEFTQPEKYHARDILIRSDEKRPEKEAQKLAADVRKQLTPANFAKMAAKFSEDPGSSKKGGDLGERDHGSMMPEFEQAIMGLDQGKISEPVKIGGGYHLIYLESKKVGSTTPLEKAEHDIARKLLARTKEAEIVAHLRGTIEKGDKKEVDAMLSKAGIKWQDTGEFDLSSGVVPKLGEAKDVMPAVFEKGHTTGIVKHLIPFQGNYLILDVAGWKQVQDTAPEVEGLDRMVAFKKADGALEAWAREVESKTSIQRNTRLFQ
jgi:parvulin-like peptidyl-prolyl isomerase